VLQLVHNEITDNLTYEQGKPKGTLPDISERRANYDLVKGSKYATEADLAGK
jgi:hypothetical protein